MLKTIIPGLAALLLLVGCTDTRANNSAMSSGSTYPRSVIYSCDDGTDFIADFLGHDVTLSIATASASSLNTTLTQQLAASGILYSNGSYEFRGKGNSALLRMPGRKAPANCSAMES